MNSKCDQGILTFLSAGLSIISIMSHISNQSLHRQLEECQSKLLHCKEMQLITVRNVLEQLLSIQTFIPRQKETELLKLQHYLSSLAPQISRDAKRDVVGMTTYSCREHFKLGGWPWTKGFLRENCTRPSIYKSTTLILSYPVFRDNRFNELFDKAYHLFHHIIIILNNNKSNISSHVLTKTKDNRIDIINIPSRSGYSYGDALNNAVDTVDSPFVLIAPYLGRLDKNVDIERLINVQELTGAAIVGGAIKDINTGIWDRGCYQVHLKLYTLKYITGYYISHHECLYCDFIVSPFLARTEFLKKHRFKKWSYGVLEDFLLRMKQAGEKVLTCPDVMFYLEKQKHIRSHLVYFAEQWDVRRIYLADGTVLWFGYRVGSEGNKNIDFKILGNYKPQLTCGASTSLSVSPDCRHNLLDAIMFILDLCKQQNIVCELQEGTLLGVVKFNHILPWERDADITFLSHQYHRVKKLQYELIRRGYEVVLISESKYENGQYHGGIIYVKAYGWNIEMYGFPNVMKRTKPYTLVKLGDHWVNGPENPGLYARNRYGREIYRHAEHWRENNRMGGFSTYVTGKFPECIRPAHHSCLDQFHADGDMQFRDFL